MSKNKNTVEYDLFADFGTVDEGNIVAGAVMQTVEEAQNREPKEKYQRIEDFGEKIGGARKDLYAAYCDLIRVAIETEVEGVPLSKSFPAPNYKKILESGVESWKVDAVRALRDAIPLKPRKYSWLIRETLPFGVSSLKIPTPNLLIPLGSKSLKACFISVTSSFPLSPTTPKKLTLGLTSIPIPNNVLSNPNANSTKNLKPYTVGVFLNSVG